MRNVLKGFVAVSVVLTAFLCGFRADALRDAPRHPQAAAWRLSTTPAALLARLAPLRAGASSADDNLTPTDTFYAVLNTIRDDFYSPQPGGDRTAPDAKKLTYAAVDGMLASIGDRYTEFWTPDEYRDNMQETRGEFVGIGARLDFTKDKRVLVVEPIEGSPAAQKGVLPGDIIVAIDGRTLLGLKLDAVIDRIRGKEGTPIKLTIERKGAAHPLTFALIRAVVNSPIVQARMEDDARKIGYISLDMFNENADKQFDAALAKLEGKGMRALIFDLRDNPGGLLDVAQDLASRFIEKGPIVWTREKNGRMSSLNVEGNKHRGGLSRGVYPVVVLVNGGSASASEIVSGAIQDSGTGVLLGTTTFGKGLVQTIIPLGDSAVKITTQHYFTRNKRDINKKLDATGKRIGGGIDPDIKVELTEKDLDAKRAALRDNPQDKRAADRVDPQLNKALEVLSAKLK